MTTPKTLKKDAFISYARRDGREAADKLFKLLEAHDLSAWQDVVSMAAGDNWWQQIREAIEGSKSMVLVLTEGAVNSTIVKREWAHARRSGTAILPVTTDLHFYDGAPRWVGEVHGFILNEDHPDYARTLEAFLEQLRHPNPPPPVPMMAPLLPLEFASRQGKQAEILERLLQTDDVPTETPAATPPQKARTATVALLGEAGMGKSTLAQAVCYEQAIIENYTGGVLYVEVGESAAQMGDKLNRVLVELHDAPTTPGKAPDRLRELLRERTCLIVFDDVWDDKVIEPYLGIDGQSYLITTREAAVAARDSSGDPVHVRQMQTGEAAQMLLNYVAADKRPDDGLAQLEPLAQRLGEWALLLDGAGRELRTETSQGSSLTDAIAWVQEGLDESGLTAESDFATALDARMQSSLRRFSADEKQRLFELSIFPDDVDVPEAAALRLWSQTSTLSKRQGEKLLRSLAGQFFLRDAEGGAPVIRFHDALREYLAGKLGNDGTQTVHEALIAAYRADCPDGWPSGPNDGYFFERLAYHLYHAGRKDELYALLTDSPAWMAAKFTVCIGDASYVEDLTMALSDFHDPLPNKDAGLNIVRLHSARQVIHARVSVYGDTDLRTLVWLGREREALVHARLRADADTRFISLLAVYQARKERGSKDITLLREALNEVRRIEDISRKVWALGEMADLLVHEDNGSQAVLEEALSAARGIKAATGRAKALSVLAKVDRDSMDVFEEALYVARGIEDASSRAEALSAVAQAQIETGENSQDVLYEAMSAATEIEDAIRKSWVLIAMAEAQARAGHYDEALARAREIEDVWRRSVALRTVAVEQANAGHYDEALSVTREIEDVGRRAVAVRAVAIARAKAGRYDEALALVREIDDTWEAHIALRAVAVTQAKAGYHDQALELARGIADTSRRVNALLAVAKVQSNMDLDCRQVLDEVLVTAQMINHSVQRARALSGVAEALAKSGIDSGQVLEDALALAREIEEPSSWASALSALANTLVQAGADSNEILDRALASARNIEDSDRRTSALCVIAEMLANMGVHTIAVRDEALASARNIEDPDRRTSALCMVAKMLAKVSIDNNDVLDEALVSARAIENDITQAWAIHALTDARVQAGYYDLALVLAREINEPSLRASALSMIVAALAKVKRNGDALALVREMENKNSRIEALSIIASTATGIDSGQLLEEALALAHETEEPSNRSSALRAVAKARLALEIESGSLLDELLILAREIESTNSRIAALLAVAEIQTAGGIGCESVLAEACMEARGVEDPMSRALLLKEIAETQGRAGIDNTNMLSEAGAAAQVSDIVIRTWMRDEIAATQATAGFVASALDTLGARDPAKYVQAIAELWEAFERIAPGLGLAALREALRIVCWVRPSWQPIYESVARAAAQDD